MAMPHATLLLPHLNSNWYFFFVARTYAITKNPHSIASTQQVQGSLQDTDMAFNSYNHDILDVFTLEKFISFTRG